MKERGFRSLEKEKKCIEARKKNETMIENYRKKILEKINNVEEKIKKQQEHNTRNSIEKYIEISIRKEDIENNIEQNEKAMEYLRIQRLEEIETKNKKVEEMKQQKIELMEEKRSMGIELQRSKEKMLLKLKFLKKTNKYKDRNQIYNELFNENSNNNNEESIAKSTRQLKTNLYDNITLLEKAHNLQNSTKGDILFMTNKLENKQKKTINEIVNENSALSTKKEVIQH